MMGIARILVMPLYNVDSRKKFQWEVFVEVWRGPENTKDFRVEKKCPLNRISHSHVNEFGFSGISVGWYDF
jgi:hypothetical protein